MEPADTRYDAHQALRDAIEIAKIYVGAGLEKDSPAKVIRETYAAIVKIPGVDTGKAGCRA